MTSVLGTRRRVRGAGQVLAVLCLSVAGRGLASAAEPPAELPVAPSPEAVIPAAATMPSAASLDRSGPVPLGPLPGTADSAGRNGAVRMAPRPLPDWKLLAAIGAAFAALAGFRLYAGRSRATLPPDVFEVLGEASLGGQHAVRIVRFGPQTLLLGISSAGCQTLAELSDPQSTERIVAACRGSRVRGPEASRQRRLAPASPAQTAAARAAGSSA